MYNKYINLQIFRIRSALVSTAFKRLAVLDNMSMETKPLGQHRLNFLQGLRGVAACIVVIHHFCCGFYPRMIFATGSTHMPYEALFWQTPLGIFISGPAPVALFFILSGFVLSLPYLGNSAKNNDQLLTAIVKRPFRLLGLVYLTMLAAFLMHKANLFTSLQASDATGSDWLRNQFNGNVSVFRFMKDLLVSPFESSKDYNQPLWTISIEMIGSYLTYLVVLLLRHSKLRYPAYFLIGLQLSNSLYCGFLIGIIFADLTKLLPAVWNRFDRFWISIPLLGLGCYIAAYPPFVDQAALAESWYSFFPRFTFIERYALIGATLLFLAVSSSILLQRMFSTALLTYLGRISFALYAVHLLLLRSFSCWFFTLLNLKLSYNLSFAFTAAASALLTVAVAHCLTIYFDEHVIRISDRIADFWNKSKQLTGSLNNCSV